MVMRWWMRCLGVWVSGSRHVVRLGAGAGADGGYDMWGWGRVVLDFLVMISLLYSATSQNRHASRLRPAILKPPWTHRPSYLVNVFLSSFLVSLCSCISLFFCLSLTGQDTRPTIVIRRKTVPFSFPIFAPLFFPFHHITIIPAHIPHNLLYIYIYIYIYTYIYICAFASEGRFLIPSLFFSAWDFKKTRLHVLHRGKTLVKKKGWASWVWC